MAGVVLPSNLMEEWWAWYLANTTPFFQYGIGVLIIHEVVYFGSFLPFWLADFLPFLHKYKIQSDKVNDGAMLWRCFKRLMFLHFVIEAPMILVSHHVLKYFGFSMTLPLPSWQIIAFQCFCFFAIEDFYFYWVHRLLHHQSIYKHIHKVHHDHAAPFGMAAEYAHPIETAFLGIGTILGPVICAMTVGMHLVTLYVWLVVRVLQTVEVHSGYDFPWSLNNWVPLWGGAEFHDWHHKTFTGNYSSTFTLWDWVFGTSSAYLAAKHKKVTALKGTKTQ